MVLSDLGAIAKQQHSHRTAKTAKEAITNSIKAGLDMQFYDYSHDEFQQAIIEAVNDNSLTIADVDRAVSSVLYVKFSLGLFENPYIDTTLKSKRYHSAKNQALALESAQKSIILLQNKNDLLPLGNQVKKIAIIGELANKTLLGGYSPKKVDGVSIIDAFKDTDYEIEYIEVGAPTNYMEEIDSRYLVTENGEKGLQVEYFNNTQLTGKPALTQVETNLSNYWHNLSPGAGVSDNNFSIRWSGYLIPELTGMYEFGLVADDIAKLSLAGKELIDNWDKDLINKWSYSKIRLEKGQKYPIKLEFAELEQYASSKETMFEKSVNAARNADVVILVIGEGESGEGLDKLSLELNDYNKKLLDQVTSTGTPTVLVLQNGRPLVLKETYKKVDAILERWYAGELGGSATVDIITGKSNPSGKLPITFPGDDGQIPIYYNQKKSSTGSYVDGSNKPLFAFGHGLSYSKFEYADLKIEKPVISKNEEQVVTVKLKNTSNRAGREIVQLYIVDSYSSVVTQKMQLREFSAVEIDAGEEKEIAFTLLPDDLGLWNADMKRVIEAGEFQVKIGAASDDIRLESKFMVK